ncbi:hypothetical protein SKAU_G00296820 [Synaphobranchus kaupii]|uniref:Uncharacterized protein n=1 Tax=Synaphobranchus kaupii TaxID=118154 RepID=A0A9Q1EUV1_SYNKA|nr:hypothetical protein SKAU_G00296820 [Synaphobranchus kaupii]
MGDRVRFSWDKSSVVGTKQTEHLPGDTGGSFDGPVPLTLPKHWCSDRRLYKRLVIKSLAHEQMTPLIQTTTEVAPPEQGPPGQGDDVAKWLRFSSEDGGDGREGGERCDLGTRGLNSGSQPPSFLCRSLICPLSSARNATTNQSPLKNASSPTRRSHQNRTRRGQRVRDSTADRKQTRFVMKKSNVRINCQEGDEASPRELLDLGHCLLVHPLQKAHNPVPTAER